LGGSGLVVALLLFHAAAPQRGQARGGTPARELEKENAALRALLKLQGRWKMTKEETKLTVEGERWYWARADDGKVVSSGRLKVVHVGPERMKVDLRHLTGDGKGRTVKAILHVRGEDTLLYHGSFDDYPKDFADGAVFKRIRR
jgi:hypothetical protein